MANDDTLYGMPKVTGEYLMKLLDAASTNPELEALVRASHQILAGGSVDVRVVVPGDAAQVAALDAVLIESLKTSNAINAAAGTYITIGAP